MMPKLIIVVIIFCTILLGSTGLEFTLDVSSAESGAVCGILKCKEGYATNENDSLNSISTMTIVKTTRPRSSEKGSIVASLTQQEANIDRVSDGIKVKGYLEAKRAIIQLDIKKKEDCSAYYTCEVVLLSEQGKETVHSSSLHQTTPYVESPTDGGSLAPGMPMQLFLLLQQLKSSLENRLETLEMRFSTAQTHLEDKVESLQDKVQSFKDSVENKIENQVVDKLCQLDTKLSTMEAKVYPDETENYGLSWTKTLQKGQDRILSGVTTATGQIVDVLNIATSLQEGFKRAVLFQERDKEMFCNLTGEVQESIGSNQKLNQKTSNNLLQVKKQVENISQLSSSTVEKSESILTLLHETLIDTNASIGMTIQDSIYDMVYPKSCIRGMASILLNTKYPYPVIHPNAHDILNVPYLCDTDTMGGGSILIQRRTTGNTNFYRDWEAYKRGFGSLDEDFWLGNDNIYKLTSSAKYELRIDIKYDGKDYFAHYNSFSISDEENLYALTLNGYDGTAGDSLDHERGRRFSTYDKDNDAYSTNCAVNFLGAWWYGNCHNSNLNGKWKEREGKGPRWNTASGNEPATFTEMKIRRAEQ